MVISFSGLTMVGFRFLFIPLVGFGPLVKALKYNELADGDSVDLLELDHEGPLGFWTTRDERTKYEQQFHEPHPPLHLPGSGPIDNLID